MWNGKKKAVTFSFDDGVAQDRKAIEILDKYGLKATFNLNSGLAGADGSMDLPNGGRVERFICKKEDIKELYKNHEVAVHTVTHALLPSLSDERVVEEVKKDQETLSKWVGYDVVGMAYPCAPPNCDERVAKLIADNTKVQYARDFYSTHSFDMQENLYLFKPTVYWGEDCLFELAEKFIALKTEEPKTFYIWGHTYEADIDGIIDWERFESFCKLISGKEDIFYGTNKQVLLNK